MGDRSRTASITDLELSFISAGLLGEFQFRLAIGVDVRSKSVVTQHVDAASDLASLWTRGPFLNVHHNSAGSSRYVHL